jgi:hypothetical protein
VGKKKDWASFMGQQPPVATVPTTNDQTLLTAKERAIRDAVANLRPMTTFAAIGHEISYSRQYVAKQMKERFKHDPAAMWLKGDDWRIPRATAELWIREIYEG